MRRWRFSDNPNSFARVDRLVSSPNLPFGKGRRMVIKNRLVDAVIGGWQVGGITTWRSGFHINPSAGVNRANTNINVDRPDATGKPVSLDTPTTKQWFNTAAFALQPIYQFGNAARNSVPGAGRLHARFQRTEELPHHGRARAAVPVGVIQPAQSSGLGIPDCESEQPQLRPDLVYGSQYAADAVCSEVRVLIEPNAHFFGPLRSPYGIRF
jgi:hypothetical protein